MLKTIGFKSVLEAQLRGLHGVDRALIYGSWAGRYHGQPGPLPHDIDLMLIGTGDVGKARAAADGASRALSRDVNVSVLTPAEWNQAKSGFIRNLRAQPVVELLLPRDDDIAAGRSKASTGSSAQAGDQTDPSEPGSGMAGMPSS